MSILALHALIAHRRSEDGEWTSEWKRHKWFSGIRSLLWSECRVETDVLRICYRMSSWSNDAAH